MQRIAPLLAFVLLALGTSCAGSPEAGGAIVENATATPVELAVFYRDGTHWQGSLEGNATARYDGDFSSLDRLEVKRSDGSLRRYDREHLDLLAKPLADRDDVVLRIEADGIRAVNGAESEPPARKAGSYR